MKRTFYITSGSLISACLIIALTWSVGAIFGPLSQGENDSSKIVNIFLIVIITATITGGIIANNLFLKRNKSNPYD